MVSDIVIETHINPAIKKQAEAIFASEGLTIDVVFRQMLEKTVEEQCVPMDFFRPNAETMEAIAAARSGEFAGQGTIDELYKELSVEDE